MKTDIIKREDIPEWEWGDVQIKKWNFKDRVKISSFAASFVVKGQEVKTVEKDEIDTVGMTMFMIAGGISFIKDKDNYQFRIKDSMSTDEKLRFIDSINLDYDSGQYLLSKIKELNKGLDDELKK